MRSYLQACGYALLFFGVLLFVLSQGGGEEQYRLWPAWYTLISEEASEIESLLAERAPELEILSPRSLEVGINGFHGERRVPLAELDAYLIPEDPRYDPFLRSLPDLFRAQGAAGEAEIIYISRSVELESIKSRLEEAGIGPERYTLAEDIRHFPRRELMLFGGLALFVILAQRRFRATVAMLLLPWGLGIIAAGSGAGILSFLALFIIPRGTSLVLPILLSGKHLQRVSLAGDQRLEALFLALGLCAGMAFFALGSSFSDFVRFPFSAALATLLWLKARLFYEEGRVRRLIHPLFRPVSLSSRTAPVVDRKRAVVQSLLAALGMSLAVLLPPAAHGVDYLLPQPAELESADQGLSALLAESRELGRGSDLPSLADYLTHRYYQENYLFGARYELPPLDGTLTIPVYRQEEGRIVEGGNDIWRFTYTWYNAIILNETDRITHFFVYRHEPYGVKRAALSPVDAPVDGLYPGLGLLFSLLVAMLLQAYHRRRETADTRFVPRRISQTA